MMDRNVIDTGLRRLMINLRWCRDDFRDGVLGDRCCGERGGWMGGKAAGRGGVACRVEFGGEER
jgi:hypothetical protein